MSTLKIGDKIVLLQDVAGYFQSGETGVISGLGWGTIHLTNSEGERVSLGKEDCGTVYKKYIKPGSEKMTMKFNPESSKIEIDLKSMGRTKRQKYIFNRMLKEQNLDQFLKYVNSFQGLNTRSLRTTLGKPVKTGHDQLENKGNNSILHKLNEMCDPSKNHFPIGRDTSWVGIEIECFIPYSSVDIVPSDYDSAECDSCGGSGTIERSNDDTDEYDEVTCRDCDGTGSVDSEDEGAEYHAHRELRRMLKMKKIKYVTVKDDGSIVPADSDEQFPVEITVLTKTTDYKNLRQVCEFLSELGAKVNKTCGLHVHMDARHMTRELMETVAKKFERALPVLTAMVPESRRTSNYCFNRVSRNSDDRYCAINTTAYDKYKTIEIRLHSGTTDFTKISNWCNFLTAISKAEAIPKACQEVNQLTEYVSIPESLMEYISQRTALFSPKQDCTMMDALETDSTERVDIQVVRAVQDTLARRMQEDLSSVWDLEEEAV